MGKTGPCCHCGVTSTPLWRNGPPDKPILCNACGSRWRTKGSLTNYTPMHARECFELEQIKFPNIVVTSFKPKAQKSHKKKQPINALAAQHELHYYDQNFRKVVEDNGNRSGTGSTMSNSESCGHVGSIYTTESIGPAQSNAWEPQVPSKKRTIFTRLKSSAVEKLTKDLYSIWTEQQSCNISGTSEDDLLYQNLAPLDSSEIGYGSVLLRHPNSRSVEEESEASSFPVENRQCMISEAYSRARALPVNSGRKGMSFMNPDSIKLNKSTAQIPKDNHIRDKFSHEKFWILQDRNSPLISSNLNDVINFEVFMKYMSFEEQQQLMRFLPCIDTLRFPESLKSMFRSPQFLENISYFRQLLQEGILDDSFTRANAEEHCNLKSCILDNLTKSEWVEYYKMMKDETHKTKKEIEEIMTEGSCSGLAKLASGKRPLDVQTNNCSALEGSFRSPKRVCRFGAADIPSKRSAELNSGDAVSLLTENIAGFVDDESVCLSPKSIFASTPEWSSVLVPLHSTADSSDHDFKKLD